LTDEVKVEVVGAEVLEARLATMGIRIRRDVKKALARGGAAMLQAARSSAPQKTGKLRSSIRMRVKDTLDGTGVWMKVTVGEWYGHLLEEGVDSQRGDYRVWTERKGGAGGRLGGKRKRFRVKKRTFRIAARPFFAPAWERTAPRLEAEVGSAVHRAVQEKV